MEPVWTFLQMVLPNAKRFLILSMLVPGRNERIIRSGVSLEFQQLHNLFDEGLANPIS